MATWKIEGTLPLFILLLAGASACRCSSSKFKWLTLDATLNCIMPSKKCVQALLHTCIKCTLQIGNEMHPLVCLFLPANTFQVAEVYPSVCQGSLLSSSWYKWHGKLELTAEMATLNQTHRVRSRSNYVFCDRLSRDKKIEHVISEAKELSKCKIEREGSRLPLIFSLCSRWTSRI